MLARSLILKTTALRPVERMVRRSFLFKPLVKRFIAGDTLDEALAVAEDLVGRGFFVSLDNLGENTKVESEALDAKATYIRMLERIAESKCHIPPREVLIPTSDGSERTPLEATNISIKLTQCGFDLGDDFAEKHYRHVLDVAARLNNFVRVDMESSDYTQRTVDMIERVTKDYSNTGTVLQSYLYRTADDVERMISLGLRVRLVKGAYLEPATVAFKEKAKADEAYVKESKRLMESGRYPAIATHDERIINELNAFATERKIDKSRFEYQMLFGIRRDLQDRLMREGYNVRVYVPFGNAWYPYFTRRLAERPANALFIAKSLFKG